MDEKKSSPEIAPQGMTKEDLQRLVVRKRIRRFLESWRRTFQLVTWTKKDTAELVVSILSGICGSLLCLWMVGVI